MHGVTTFRRNNKRFIRCDICKKYPLIVKNFVPRKLPAITTDAGTRYPKSTLNDHLKSPYHIGSLKASRIGFLEEKIPPMEVAISKANKKIVDYVGMLMIQVFNDAKRLNLSAWSWPSRFVAGAASFGYESQPDNQVKFIIPVDLNLQYVNSPSHLELMTTLVTSHRKDFLKKTY